MWMILVLLLLPFIFMFSSVAAPFLFVIGRTVHSAELLNANYGGAAEFMFFILLIWLVVFCGKSKWFFWLGLVPVLALSTWLGGWN
jgi:hypothetical protein